MYILNNQGLRNVTRAKEVYGQLLPLPKGRSRDPDLGYTIYVIYTYHTYKHPYWGNSIRINLSLEMV